MKAVEHVSTVWQHDDLAGRFNDAACVVGPSPGLEGLPDKVIKLQQSKRQLWRHGARVSPEAGPLSAGQPVASRS